LITDLNKRRVAIVDDEELSRERMRTLLAEHNDIEVVAECADGAEALRAIDDKNPDLVFLDVQMPEVDGFEVVEALERGDPEAPSGNGGKAPAIVFVTAHDDHALKAFEIHALDFLLKPFDAARFEKTLSRARRHVRQSRDTVDARLLALLEDLRSERRGQRHSDRLIVKSGGRVFFLRTEEIDWVEAAGNYVRLHARSESHLLRESMKNMEAKLDPKTFVRIHRSAIVNARKVRAIGRVALGKYCVRLHDGRQLPMSRDRRRDVTALILSSA